MKPDPRKSATAILAVVGLRDLNGRQWDDYDLLSAELERYRPWIAKVISGGARGTDRLAIRWAKACGLATEEYLPDLRRHGSPLAYFVRNRSIGEACDLMVAFWDGTSAGTRHAISYAESLGRPVEIIDVARNVAPPRASLQVGSGHPAEGATQCCQALPRAPRG